VTLNTRALKVMSGVGAVVICGVSGVLVAIDPKPAAAPLRPLLAASPSEAAGLVIPQSCGTVAAVDPSLLPVAEQVQNATSAAERSALLAPLTASQRLEVEAYVRAQRRHTTGRTGNCSSPSSAGGTIAPSVVDAPPSTQPLINTYVS
jgi:hypothetical protein